MSRLRVGTGTVIVGEAGLGKSVLIRAVRDRLRGGSPNAEFVRGDIDGAELRAVAERLNGRAAVLMVDDIQLLDEDSARLLSRLVAVDEVRLVATLRSERTAFRRFAGLWTSGQCERLDLPRLDVTDIRQLLADQLGADVDEQLAMMIAERSNGNALFVRELIRAGLRDGAIRHERGLWRLAGTLPVTGAAGDLIRANLAGVGPSHLRALQLVALAEPLRLTIAERITEPGALEALEERELVVLRAGDASSVTLSCPHPIYAEVIRADIGPLRTRRMRGELLRAMAENGPMSDREHVLVVSWRVDLGEQVAIEELVKAAQDASSPAVCERLLRAALSHSGLRQAAPADVVDAAVLLAQMLLLQGRVAEGEQVLDRLEQGDESIDLSGVDEQRRQRLTTTRVIGRAQLGEIADALRLTADTSGHPTAESVGSVWLLQAMSAAPTLLEGRPDDVIRITAPLATRTEDPLARATAAYLTVVAHSFAGRVDDTKTTLATAVPIVRAVGGDLPYGMAFMQVSTAICLLLDGRFADAEGVGLALRDAALGGDEWARPRSATVVGLLALFRGQVQQAIQQLRIATVSLNPMDGMFLRYNLAFLARASALAGNLDSARQALAPPPDAPSFPLYEADWQVAEAAVLAGGGRLHEAAARAEHAAEIAIEHGQWAIAAHAAHDAVRYDRSPRGAALLSTAADAVDGALPRLMREHAEALLAQDGSRLENVSNGFEDIGAVLFAAEAAQSAATSYHRATKARAASAAAVRAAELRDRCRGTVAPWCLGPGEAVLTARERQIALLAAAGHPDQHISTVFGISIRTVQTHLTNIYTKLEVAGRRELATALAMPAASDMRRPSTTTNARTPSR